MFNLSDKILVTRADDLRKGLRLVKGVDFVAVIVSLCKQTFRLRHWFVLAAEFLTL